MKVKKLTVKNIGPVGDIELSFESIPLILLYGDIRAGKTTILNSVRWVLGGKFPTDIIRHGETEAMIRLDTDTGSITREFYVGRDGTNKAREVVFMQHGQQVSNPVRELQKFLNPFLLDQDHLRNMTEPERKRFFVEIFGLDTSDLDEFIARNEQQAQVLRAEISGYGDIDLSGPNTPINTEEIQKIKAQRQADHEAKQVERSKELQTLRVSYATAVQDANRFNQDARNHLHRRLIAQADADILRGQISALTQKLGAIEEFLKNNPRIAETSMPVPPNRIAELESLLQVSRPDTSDLDKQLIDAAAYNEKVSQTQKNLDRQKEKLDREARLKSVIETLDGLRKDKIARLQVVQQNCKVPGVKFDAVGNLTYEDTQAGMLSTSQVMKLSAALSALYPENFGLELIDRAESLGKSIFTFIEKAKAEDKTILATIVGEKPAIIPADVGVFVVENGQLK